MDAEAFSLSAGNWHDMCKFECQHDELTNQESVSVAQGWWLCAGGEVSGSTRSDLRGSAPRP